MERVQMNGLGGYNKKGCLIACTACREAETPATTKWLCFVLQMIAIVSGRSGLATRAGMMGWLRHARNCLEGHLVLDRSAESQSLVQWVLKRVCYIGDRESF